MSLLSFENRYMMVKLFINLKKITAILVLISVLKKAKRVGAQKNRIMHSQRIP